MFINFSIKPLRIVTFSGFFTAILCVGIAIWSIIDKLSNPSMSHGWASIIVAVLFSASIQMIFLGIIGEHIGKHYLDRNGTPQWVKAQAFLRQVVRFSIVGAINAAITYGIYSGFIFLGLSYRLALVLEYCLGIPLSFSLHKRFTFRAESPAMPLMFGRMVASYVFVLLLNMALLSWFVERIGLDEYVGQLFALAIS